MTQNGDAGVHLVVNAEDDACADVVTDVHPVEVVPETLLQPVDGDLK